MAAYAALVSLLNNIHHIADHPRLSNSFDDKDIQPLLEKTDFLLDCIEGYNYGGGSKESQDLERQIASTAHAAEDVIESHIVDQIHDGTSEASLSCSLDLKRIIQDMNASMEKTTKFKEIWGFKEEKSTHQPGSFAEIGKTAMVGLDAELIQLLDELTGYRSNRHVISIVGMGGSGKTTLAKNVYDNLLIKERFQFRAWATISQQNNSQEILSKLLYGLGELSCGSVDDLGLQLHKTLSGRRYLIVLDDIWSVKAWDEVKRLLPDDRNGSRVLLTTRLSNVAKDSASSLFMMNLLDEGNSWKLFCEKAFQSEDCPLELREVGEEIVKSCKGLPLSIVVIGGLLLHSPRNVRFWKEVAKHLKSIPNAKEKQESLDVLSLSYKHLPSHLKPCFLYIGVFKEDCKIRVSSIIKLWVAEGFIKPIGSRVLEEIAEVYLKDLIDRNLILIGRRRKNGKVGSIGIHDLLRDLCIKLAEQEDFYHVNKGGIQGKKRRLVVYRNIKLKRMKHPLTRSVMASGRIKQPVRYRLLRVLHQSGYTYKGDYYGNVNLRYLICKHPFDLQPVWNLPTSISLMWNLQTLIIEAGFFWFVDCCTARILEDATA